ncbi:hypothetical protein R1sor_027038 [Riccia sorocarpa]|uniref:Uncharacterized protein n=1 Tax=Riccia sorocarpa TaxID=122646 RepID=A0ABD3GG88_9MARC
MHLCDTTGAWRDLKGELNRIGYGLSPVQEDAIRSFQEWLRTGDTNVASLQSSSSWRWKGGESEWKGWTRGSVFWGKLLDTKEDSEDLSEKWRIGGSKFTWAQQWRKLWASKASTRTKLCCWRILKHGFFTGLLDTFDEAFTNNRKGSSLIHIVAITTQHIWRDRNLTIFQKKDTVTPIEVILQAARHEAEGTLTGSKSEANWSNGMSMLKELSRLLQEENQHEGSQRGSNCMERRVDEGEELQIRMNMGSLSLDSHTESSRNKAVRLESRTQRDRAPEWDSNEASRIRRENFYATSNRSPWLSSSNSAGSSRTVDLAS